MQSGIPISLELDSHKRKRTEENDFNPETEELKLKLAEKEALIVELKRQLAEKELAPQKQNDLPPLLNEAGMQLIRNNQNSNIVFTEQHKKIINTILSCLLVDGCDDITFKMLSEKSGINDKNRQAKQCFNESFDMLIDAEILIYVPMKEKQKYRFYQFNREHEQYINAENRLLHLPPPLEPQLLTRKGQIIIDRAHRDNKDLRKYSHGLSCQGEKHINAILKYLLLDQNKEISSNDVIKDPNKNTSCNEVFRMLTHFNILIETCHCPRKYKFNWDSLHTYINTKDFTIVRPEQSDEQSSIESPSKITFANYTSSSVLTQNGLLLIEEALKKNNKTGLGEVSQDMAEKIIKHIFISKKPITREDFKNLYSLSIYHRLVRAFCDIGLFKQLPPSKGIKKVQHDLDEKFIFKNIIRQEFLDQIQANSASMENDLELSNQKSSESKIQNDREISETPDEIKQLEEFLLSKTANSELQTGSQSMRFFDDLSPPSLSSKAPTVPLSHWGLGGFLEPVSETKESEESTTHPEIIFEIPKSKVRINE